MIVVVVESPAKAKTINKYLGSEYEVLASFGHVRDLPAKDGSVDPEADFKMIWELEGRGAKQVSEIARAAKGATKLILATDPDREGEAISWHVLEALNQKRALKGVAVERVTFNAITKQAVQEAMRAPREIDQALVDAYLARRALDYLVGFTLSPVLWRKLPGARSAGRVQSVSLRLVCDREREIETFVRREYWSLVATLATKDGSTFEARLVGADGKRINRLDVGNAEEAAAFKSALEAAAFTVTQVEAKPAKRHPQPPFTTSTLQQEASRKLGFAPARTMQLAQRLYEGIDLGGETVGLITYMRTDGVDMAPEAVQAVRRVIAREHGDKYVPHVPRKYTVKAKNAQEAHEAVRPTDPGRLPSAVRGKLELDQLKLYELIWTRTVASQMESAELMRTAVDIEAKAGERTLALRASGQVVLFDGFLALYREGRDDPEQTSGSAAVTEDDDESRRLPKMAAGERLEKRQITSTQHFTEPPPRFTEASLVKRMEELGIGRPSTYAAILSVLRERDYVTIDKKRLVPQDKGRLVTGFLEKFVPRLVQYDFTAGLEEELDKVSADELDWKELLRRFWTDFSGAVAETKELRTTQVIDALNEWLGPYLFPPRADGADPRACTVCGNGQLSLKLGKFGSFLGCSNYPECRYTRPLASSSADGAAAAEAGTDGTGPKSLGADPAGGGDVTIRDGRFGTYVQLGEGEKPKRVSLPKGMTVASVDLDRALALLALPKEVAKHPESGEPILVGVGRYGPYVQHGRTYANLERDDDVLSVGANRAIDLIVAKEQGGGRGQRPGGDAAGRVLGQSEDLPGTITVKAGKYGPYVTNGKLNATLPKALTAEEVTLDEAVSLLKLREGAAPSSGRKKAAAKKPAAGKAAPAKKAAAAKAPAAKAAAAKIPAAKAPAGKPAAAKSPKRAAEA